MLSTNDILLAYVIFEDTDGEKMRPVLFLYKEDESYIVFEIRSSYGDENHLNPTPRQKEFFLELEDWQNEGLAKQSWINTEQEIELIQSDFKDMRLDAIGKLSLRDARRLRDFAF